MTAALIAQLALATFVVVQFTKFIVDGIISPSNPNANNIVRLYVYFVAVIVCALSVPLAPVHSYSDVAFLADAKLLLVSGFQVFAAAVATYHCANGLDATALINPVVARLKPPVDPAPPAA